MTLAKNYHESESSEADWQKSLLSHVERDQIPLNKPLRYVPIRRTPVHSEYNLLVDDPLVYDPLVNNPLLDDPLDQDHPLEIV